MDQNVKLYALSTCIHCKHTKEFLDEKGVSYDCCFVDTLSGDEKKDILEEVKQYNPKLSFPTLLIGDKCIVGFKKQEIEEALAHNEC